MASSKTEERPVWVKSCGESLGKNMAVSNSPRVRIVVDGSSRRVRRGGMKRCHVVGIAASCVRVLGLWVVGWSG